MKKVEEYRRHAEECREMADRATKPDHRKMLLNMAKTWEQLAEARQAHTARQRRLAELEALPGVVLRPKTHRDSRLD
jgi:hypothetical protein